MPNQDFLGQISDTTTESGNDLAARLNAFDLAVKSGFTHTARPSGIAAGGVWTRDNGDGTYTRMIYDGSSDVEIGSSGLLVSGDDTTAGDLETKLIVGDGLSLSTTNGGSNEKRKVDLSFASQAEAEAGTATDKPLNALRVAQAIAEQAPASGAWVEIGDVELSSDSNSLTVTGLSGYSEVRARAFGFLSSGFTGANVKFQARASGGTWRNLLPLVGVDGGDFFTGSVEIVNFNNDDSTTYRMCEGYLYSEEYSGPDFNDDEFVKLVNKGAALHHRPETWDELRVNTDKSGGFNGTTANRKTRLIVEARA
jgi:hypothetical protein